MDKRPECNFFVLSWVMQGVECVEQIKELILAHCEKACPPTVTEQLEKYLNDTAKPVGLLLSERFINVPPQIALPLHTQLQWVLSPLHCPFSGLLKGGYTEVEPY